MLTFLIFFGGGEEAGRVGTSGTDIRTFIEKLGTIYRKIRNVMLFRLHSPQIPEWDRCAAGDSRHILPATGAGHRTRT